MLIYHYHPIIKEYLGTSEYNPPEGVGLPAHSTESAPPQTFANQLAQFNNDEWRLIDDYRGQTFYNKENGLPFLITQIGEVDNNLTAIPPTSEFEVWTKGAWVTDKEAQNQKNILDQIYALEQQVTPRRIREAVLDLDNGWLASIESQITVLRAQL